MYCVRCCIMKGKVKLPCNMSVCCEILKRMLLNCASPSLQAKKIGEFGCSKFFLDETRTSTSRLWELTPDVVRRISPSFPSELTSIEVQTVDVIITDTIKLTIQYYLIYSFAYYDKQIIQRGASAG